MDYQTTYFPNDKDGILMPSLEAGYQVPKGVRHIERVQVPLLGMPVTFQLH